jgi:hypothetical protein
MSKWLLKKVPLMKNRNGTQEAVCNRQCELTLRSSPVFFCFDPELLTSVTVDGHVIKVESIKPFFTR